ncbi:hypothetical protein [Flavihumibacter petaseus]|uniref:Uncharacterized protein n=1 Tax=Flavihumibacter petaseus NBRC 106054 TaxID=1220578 RepID=A0A0E9N2D2_9BACT|nr:hypothetical protein [Flavihumibacter petaseus]GAO44162.1 hypothetical protein FPE01S_03_02000 [Flavihumibacter petaseus NBRC 106054]
MGVNKIEFLVKELEGAIRKEQVKIGIYTHRNEGGYIQANADGLKMMALSLLQAAEAEGKSHVLNDRVSLEDLQNCMEQDSEFRISEVRFGPRKSDDIDTNRDA